MTYYPWQFLVSLCHWSFSFRSCVYMLPKCPRHLIHLCWMYNEHGMMMMIHEYYEYEPVQTVWKGQRHIWVILSDWPSFWWHFWSRGAPITFLHVAKSYMMHSLSEKGPVAKWNIAGVPKKGQFWPFIRFCLPKYLYEYISNFSTS